MEMLREGGSGKAKKTEGRKKIEIKRIEKQSSRQVTFSKRRVGLFKKASELCILSGAQVAIVVHSNGKRVFSFGHPTADAVIDRYLSGGGGDDDDARENSALQVVPNMGDYNKHYSDVSKELDVEKKRRLGENTAGSGGSWWQDGVEGKGVEELEQYAAALEELRKKVTSRADDFMVMHSSNSFLPAVPAALMAVHNPHMEAPPPLTSAVLDDNAAFVNQNFHNQVWSGYDFGQGNI